MYHTVTGHACSLRSVIDILHISFRFAHATCLTVTDTDTKFGTSTQLQQKTCCAKFHKDTLKDYMNISPQLLIMNLFETVTSRQKLADCSAVNFKQLFRQVQKLIISRRNSRQNYEVHAIFIQQNPIFSPLPCSQYCWLRLCQIS